MQVHKETEELKRERLLSGFLAAVKVCQVRYGGRTELATESDPRVATLCQCLEETLTHGLRSRISNRGIGSGAIRQVTDLVTSGLNFHLTLGNSDRDVPVLWWYVRELLTKHEYERFALLRNVTCDEGRGRAWLRSLLNEHSLERYIHIMLSDESFLELWYEPWALLRDQERAAMLPNLAGGLDSILFAINIDNAFFNNESKSTKTQSSSEKKEPEPEVAQLDETYIGNGSDKVTSPKSAVKKKKRRKVPSQLVSFDDGINSTSGSPVTSGWFSAPATIVNTPTGTSHSGTHGSVCEYVSDHSTMYNIPKQQFDSIPDSRETNQKLVTTETGSTSLSIAENKSSLVSSESKVSYNEVNKECTTPEIDTSYTRVIEDLLASESFSFPTASADTKETSADKSNRNYHTSTNSLFSNVSADSSHSSERRSIDASLFPVGGNSGGLIPLSPEGEVAFHADAVSGDATSLKSSSQDEFDMSDSCVPLTAGYDKKAISASGSLNSVASLVSAGPDVCSKGTAVSSSRFSSLSHDELRTAVLEISRARDAIEQKRTALSVALNTEMESSSTLRAQLASEQTQRKELNDRLQAKINTLTRENELLRHQLKKYISAVQMLSRGKEGAVGDEDHLAPVCKSHPEIRDYHDEAAAYENKLIQVAEMHGELIEFNERLQRLLQYRESQLHHLREELVELRGPLPSTEDEDDFDETLSMTSDLDSVSSLQRTLINIWIPTAFLAGPSSDTHHVYQIYVRIKDVEWNVYRRFAQFFDLHKRYKKKDAIVRTLDFPQKKAFGYKRQSRYLHCIN